MNDWMNERTRCLASLAHSSAWQFQGKFPAESSFAEEDSAPTATFGRITAPRPRRGPSMHQCTHSMNIDMSNVLTKIPFIEHLGATLHRFAGGEAELRLRLQEHHLNSWQVAHGGIVMTLLDSVMGLSARSAHEVEPGRVAEIVTVQMNTHFTKAGIGELRATGRLLHRSFSLILCEASVTDRDGTLCAHGTGTFKYLMRVESPHRSQHNNRQSL